MRRNADRRYGIIIDIGAGYTTCGIAKEGHPRCTFRTPVNMQSLLLKWPGDSEKVREELRSFLRSVLMERLHSSVQNRTVVLCCNANSNDTLLHLMSRILVENFRVKDVEIACSQLLALFPTESDTGLVLDCGYEETRAMASMHGNALQPRARYIPLGGRHVLESLRESVLSLNPFLMERSLEHLLTPSFLEDLLVKAGRVLTPAQVPEIVAYPMGLETLQVDASSCFEVLFDCSRHLEDWCIANALLDVLLQCDAVTKAAVSKNIVICGGMADVPGFQERLVHAAAHLCKECPKYQCLQHCLLKHMSLSTPAVPSYLMPWVGASVVSAVSHTIASTAPYYHSSRRKS